MAKPDAELKRKLEKAAELMSRDAFAEAGRAYDKILAKAPKNKEARYNRAVAHAQLREFDAAVAAVRSLLSDLPDVGAAHAQFASALREFVIPRFAPGIALKPISELKEPLKAYLAATHDIPLIGACNTLLVEVLSQSDRKFEAQLAQGAASLYTAELQEAMMDIGANLTHPGKLSATKAMHQQAVAQTPDQWQMSEDEYLESDLAFSDDEIVTEDGLEVMMEWERPIMERSAEIICHNRGDVMNVGFGMAIIDTAIQRHGPATHTIIEAHPQVIKRAENWAHDKSGVRIIPSKWQDALERLDPLDGIYFDTLIPPILPFLRHVPKILKDGGVFSFFQYMMHLQNLAVMVRDDLEFGVEFLEFDDLPQNTYYRLNAKTADGRFAAPLFIFRKRTS